MHFDTLCKARCARQQNMRQKQRFISYFTFSACLTTSNGTKINFIILNMASKVRLSGTPITNNITYIYLRNSSAKLKTGKACNGTLSYMQ